MLFCRLSFLKERFTLAVVVHWKLVSDTIYSLTSRMYRIGSHPRCVPDHTSALLCGAQFGAAAAAGEAPVL